MRNVRPIVGAWPPFSPMKPPGRIGELSENSTGGGFFDFLTGLTRDIIPLTQGYIQDPNTGRWYDPSNPLTTYGSRPSSLVDPVTGKTNWTPIILGGAAVVLIAVLVLKKR